MAQNVALFHRGVQKRRRPYVGENAARPFDQGAEYRIAEAEEDQSPRSPARYRVAARVWECEEVCVGRAGSAGQDLGQTLCCDFVFGL